MNTTKVLNMDFLDEGGKNFRPRVRDPKNDLDRTTVASVMDGLITVEVFAAGAKLQAKKACKVVTATKETLFEV